MIALKFIRRASLALDRCDGQAAAMAFYCAIKALELARLYALQDPLIIVSRD